MAKKEAKKRPKQDDLPGMENREIKDLNDAAMEYAGIRDERQALTLQEVGLKSKILSLMPKHKMSDYVFEGIEIHIIVEEEGVKVKIPKKDEELTETVRV